MAARDPSDWLDPRNWGFVHLDGRPNHWEDISLREQRAAGVARNISRRSAAYEAMAALQKGANMSLGYPHLDVAGKCQLPREIERWMSPWGRIVYTVPCRTHCSWCLKMRSKEWAIRAESEVRLAHRTWFGTLTLTAEDQYRFLCKADGGGSFGIRAKNGSARELKFADLTPGEQFGARHKAISSELTKWLKRVRERSNAPLRHLLVAEAHKSGLPHYHVLIHQCSPEYPVKYRDLRDTWPFGFTNFKLVKADDFGHTDVEAEYIKPSRVAWYVCKYLTKAACARVRASGSYGTGSLRHSERVKTRPPNTKQAQRSEQTPGDRVTVIGGTD